MLHQTIKEQIKDALRAKDTIRLDVLRSLNALFLNEIIAGKATPGSEFLSDDAVLTLIKRSAKQHRDSIDQFQKGGRTDLVAKEQAELVILDSFLPTLMPRDQVHIIAQSRIDKLKSEGVTVDAKSSGKIVGMLMKELAGKADGADVKAVVEEILSKDAVK
jgi:uncharacterized protein YqeY